jgi:hypothetical protein
MVQCDKEALTAKLDRGRVDKGLWICKIKEKTKLASLLQTLDNTYSRGSVSLNKYSYAKVSQGGSRHSLKGQDMYTRNES